MWKTGYFYNAILRNRATSENVTLRTIKMIMLGQYGNFTQKNWSQLLLSGITASVKKEIIIGLIHL